MSTPPPTADELRRRAAELRHAIENKRRHIVSALTAAGVARLLDERRELARELEDVLRSIPSAVARERKAS